MVASLILRLLTETDLTAFTQLALVRFSLLCRVRWLLYRSTRPLLQSVGQAIEVRLLIQGESAKTTTSAASLVEQASIIAVEWI